MKWERTFEFSAPVEKVWQAFNDPNAPMRVFNPENAYQSRGVIEVTDRASNEHEQMSWKEVEGDDRWEMSVTFEATSTATLITLVRSGFGAGDEWMIRATSRLLGWEHVLGDLQVYFQSGEIPMRFYTTPWLRSGAAVVVVSGGVRVVSVAEGSAADKAGLHVGDVIVRAMDLPIYSLAEWWLVERLIDPDEVATFQVVRWNKLQKLPVA